MPIAMPAERIIIGNDVSELRRMTDWLRASAAAAALPADLLHKLDVCANEAVTNIISYAYDDARRHEITVELNAIPNGAALVIRDDGKPFDFLAAPASAAPMSLDDAAVGGLGIQLIRRLATRCEYRRENGINVLSLETEHTLQPDNA